MQQSSSKREVYSDTAYLGKQEKSQMNDLLLYLKHLEKEEQNKTQSWQRERKYKD